MDGLSALEVRGATPLGAMAFRPQTTGSGLKVVQQRRSISIGRGEAILERWRSVGHLRYEPTVVKIRIKKQLTPYPGRIFVAAFVIASDNFLDPIRFGLLLLE